MDMDLRKEFTATAFKTIIASPEVLHSLREWFTEEALDYSNATPDAEAKYKAFSWIPNASIWLGESMASGFNKK